MPILCLSTSKMADRIDPRGTTTCSANAGYHLPGQAGAH